MKIAHVVNNPPRDKFEKFEDFKQIADDTYDFSVIYNSYSGLTYRLLLSVSEGSMINTIMEPGNDEELIRMAKDYMEIFVKKFTAALEEYIHINILSNNKEEN